MWLIVGLGNPGPEYAGNRHNVGAWCVNRLARAHGIHLKASGKVANVGEGVIAGRRVVLARPRTFMNESGRAVRHLMDRFGVRPEELLVIYDDLDLPPGRVRVRARGGHAGHRGMASIAQHTGTTEFPRVRIGIGRPLRNGEPSWDPEVVAGYVLSDPDPEERRALEEGVARAAEAVELILRDGLERAMNVQNARA
ncbi:MAG TPA: aminoacyl-tRNA hydrolase [Dehalococcoidia bacterium]